MAGLDASIGLSALLASQRGMDVVGHNISNASTPGFTRQSVELVSATPTSSPVGGQLGTGVRVAMVRQVADAFLNGRVRVADAAHGYDSALAQRMGEIEGILGDTSQGGLGGLLSSLFTQADALALNPDDPSTRIAFLSSAARLADGFQSTASFLEESRVSVGREVVGKVNEVNQLAEQVAELNLAILNVEGSGQQANDLRDQRGRATRRLARLVGAKAATQSDGAVKVTLNGRILVAGPRARSLEVQEDSEGNGVLFFAGTARALTLDSGEIGGLLAAQQETAGILGQVDRLATGVIREANRVHATGVPGNGPYSALQTQYSVQDADLSGDPGDDPLVDAGLGFDLGPSTIAVNVTDSTGVVSTSQIVLDPRVQGLNDVSAALSAIPGLTAGVSLGGQLSVVAAAGFSFDFADHAGGDNDPGGVLAALGVNTLFSGSGALDMALRPGLESSPQALASGLGPGESDGRNALRFSEMGQLGLADLGGEDPVGFLAIVISSAGQVTKVADDRAASSRGVLNQLEAQREGVSGVSMEEEVANMIRFQRGFEAASRYISVLHGLSEELMRLVG